MVPSMARRPFRSGSKEKSYGKEYEIVERPKITVRIDPERMEEIKLYASVKGFDTPAIFTRKAIYAYMARFPITKAERAHSGMAIAVVKDFKDIS